MVSQRRGNYCEDDESPGNTMSLCLSVHLSASIQFFFPLSSSTLQLSAGVLHSPLHPHSGELAPLRPDAGENNTRADQRLHHTPLTSVASRSHTNPTFFFFTYIFLHFQLSTLRERERHMTGPVVSSWGIPQTGIRHTVCPDDLLS